MVALAPLLAVLGGALTIELAVPVVQRLAGPEGIEARPAFALFLIAAVHCALMALALKTAATMVGQWRVFGLGSSRSGSAVPGPWGDAPTNALPGRAQFPPSLRRPVAPAAEPAITASAPPPAARLGGAVTRPVVVAPGAAGPLPTLRAQGIGSRWRRPQGYAEIFR